MLKFKLYYLSRYAQGNVALFDAYFALREDPELNWFSSTGNVKSFWGGGMKLLNQHLSQTIGPFSQGARV